MLELFAAEFDPGLKLSMDAATPLLNQDFRLRMGK
jgi:hypothetical protein